MREETVAIPAGDSATSFRTGMRFRHRKQWRGYSLRGSRTEHTGDP